MGGDRYESGAGTIVTFFLGLFAFAFGSLAALALGAAVLAAAGLI